MGCDCNKPKRSHGIIPVRTCCPGPSVITRTEFYDYKNDVKESLNGLDQELSNKQNKLIAGENIILTDDPDNHTTTISSIDGGSTYTAGEGITISDENVIATIMQQSDYYNKTEVDHLLANLEGVEMRIVDTLPATGEGHIIYLVENSTGGYNQYVYSDGQWVSVGTTDAHLENYYTKVETDALLGTVKGSISGPSNPTVSTQAEYIGQHYVNTTTGQIFYCYSIEGNTYDWQPLSEPDVLGNFGVLHFLDGTTEKAVTLTKRINFEALGISSSEEEPYMTIVENGEIFNINVQDITQYDLPDKERRIGAYPDNFLKGCVNLTWIGSSSDEKILNATRIGDSFLHGCVRLGEGHEVDELLFTIGSQESTAEVSIGSHFLHGCSSLAQAITKGSSIVISSVGSYLMYNTPSYQHPFPRIDATTIGDYCFYSSGVTAIVANSCRNIGNYFGANTNLASVPSLSDITEIGNYFLSRATLPPASIMYSALRFVGVGFLYLSQGYTRIDLRNLLVTSSMFCYGNKSMTQSPRLNSLLYAGDLFLGNGDWSFDINLPSLTSCIQGFVGNNPSFNADVYLPNLKSPGLQFMRNLPQMTGTVYVGDCPAPTDLSASARNMFLSVTSATAPAYTTGITLKGTYADEWLAILPNRTSNPFRKLLNGNTTIYGTLTGASAPTTSTVGLLGQLYTDTSTMHTYQCTAISGSTYTWTQRW